MSKKIGSLCLLLLTAAIWGFAFVAQIVAAQSDVGNLTFNGVRFLLGSTSLIPVILFFERKNLTKNSVAYTMRSGLICGLILCIAANLQQYGAYLTDSAGKSSFMTGLYTVLVPIFAFLLFHKKSGWNIWVAVFLAMAGLYLLCMVGERFYFSYGEALLLIGAFFWAGHILLIDHSASQASPLLFSCIQFAVCGTISLLGGFIFESPSLSGLWELKYPILYGGLMSVGIAYTLQVVAQRRADPTSASIVLSTESIFGAIGGMLLLNETMDALNYLGCALIFIGIIVAQLELKNSKTTP